jgi:hypothetical protein
MIIFTKRSKGKPVFPLRWNMAPALAISYWIGSTAAFAQAIPAPPILPKIDANGVDVQTGNETWSVTELGIGPNGTMGLQLVRSRSGGAQRDNFSNSYVYTSNYLYGLENGHSTFGNDGDSFGQYTFSGYGIPGQNYQTGEGSIINYSIQIWDQNDPNSGSISKLYFADSKVFPNGVTWNLHYKTIAGNGRNYARLQSVTSNTGFQIKFEYYTNTMASDFSNYSQWELRTKAIAINNSIEYCDPVGDYCSLSNIWPTVIYAYSTNSQNGSSTVSVTGPAGGVTQYTSTPASGNNPLTFSITKPGSSAPDVTYAYTLNYGPCMPSSFVCQYGAPFRVSSLTTPEKTVSYSYSHISTKWIITKTEPGSKTDVYEMPAYPDFRLGLEKWTDSLGRITRFESTALGQPTKAIWPEGNFTVFQPAGCGSLAQQASYPKPGPSVNPILESRTYANYGTNLKLCGKPLTITDARGVVTYTYDTGHGGVLTELGRADNNGIRPAKKYYYEQRYALVKSPAGSFVQKSTPVWLMTEVRTCKTSTMDLNAGTCGAGSADLVRTTFDYGPMSGSGNNLLLRGKVEDAGGLAFRTCYNYDIYGRKMSETAPEAGLTTCP